MSQNIILIQHLQFRHPLHGLRQRRQISWVKISNAVYFKSTNAISIDEVNIDENSIESLFLRDMRRKFHWSFMRDIYLENFTYWKFATQFRDYVRRDSLSACKKHFLTPLLPMPFISGRISTKSWHIHRSEVWEKTGVVSFMKLRASVFGGCAIGDWESNLMKNWINYISFASI